MSDHEIVNRLRRISEYSMFDETINVGEMVARKARK
jgi:hypothetical protein